MPTLFFDFHLHSRYSRATSHDITIQALERAALQKGLNILGTGDFTHPLWLKELKENLTEIDNTGIFRTKTGFKFVLSTEISNIYSHAGKLRKVHNILLAPNFDVVEQINDFLKKYGDLEADGRPIFGNMSCPELVEGLMQISKDILIIPAHCWTPWFALFGSKSGFDSVEECFQDQSKHIYALETGMSCYDVKTEVLTNSGWKLISDVKYNDEICTLNIKTNRIEFQKPIRLFKYYYNGKMYRLKTKTIDLLVTPNHNLLYSPCNFRKKPSFTLKDATSLFGKSKCFKKDGIWKGKNSKYFILPAVKIRQSGEHSVLQHKKQKKIPIRPWLKFFGFWLAKGWVSEGKNDDYGICISDSNAVIISEIKGILESFGYKVDFYKKGTTIRIRDFQLFSYLKQFGKAHERFIPSDIKSLSTSLLEILLEYYIKGNGRYGKNGKEYSATTTSKRLRDDLQEMALKLGISACYKKTKGSWVIYFIRKNIHTVLPSKSNESWVRYKGFVYCLEVPNHVIYVRRNGIPVWCGNSDPSMNWRLSKLDKYTLVSNSDAHSANIVKLGRELNVLDIENVTYSSICDTIRKKDRKRFLYTIEVHPEFGKYHWDGHRICKVLMKPCDAIKHKNICPVCRKPLTIGVEHRVEELADRPEGFVPKDAIPFKKMIPLADVIAGVYGTQTFSKKVMEECFRLIKRFDSELNVLIEAPEEQLKEITHEKIAAAIIKNRNGEIKVIPGYDGVYGRPVFEGTITINNSGVSRFPSQKSLDMFKKKT